MLSLKLFFLLVIFATIVNGQSYDYDENYDYNSEDYDEYVDHSCDFYEADHAERGECKHDNFPTEELKDLFGAEVKTCCNEHAYFFYNQCEDHGTVESDACGDPFSDAEPTPARPVFCPQHCRLFASLQQDSFTVDKANGTMMLSNPEVAAGAHVDNYCVSYTCHSREKRWSVEAMACVCFGKEVDLAADAAVPEEMPRCCPESLQIKAEPERPEEVMCPVSKSSLRVETSNAELRHCSGEWIRLHLSGFSAAISNISFSADGSVSIHDNNKGIHKTVGGATDVQMCSGVGENSTAFGPEALLYPFEASVMYCHDDRCNGIKPCFSTCCSPLQYSNSTLPCISMDSNHTDTFLERHSALFGGPVTKANFEIASPRQRSCRKGYRSDVNLNPAKRCLDAFTLEQNPATERIEIDSKRFPGEGGPNYCLTIDEDDAVLAEICVPDLREAKFSFYPYILILSCLFLLATVLIYTLHADKLLKSYYSRLMRHLAANLFAAYFILSVNQLVLFTESAPMLCQILAFLLQYFFLSAFCFMTLMSVEIALQTNDKRSGSRRHLIELVLGYSIPGVITFFTLLVEIFAPRCLVIRPKFGQEQCFFSHDPSERTPKFLWFYTPILIMLLINTVAFGATIVAFLRIERNKRELNIRNHEARNEMSDKMIVYIKLFVGMGLLWFFEILAGAIDVHEAFWYLTDICNMSQGIYVFFVFVCKRRVIDIIMGKERARRVSAAFQRVSFKKGKRKSREQGEEESRDRTKDTHLQPSEYRDEGSMSQSEVSRVDIN